MSDEAEALMSCTDGADSTGDVLVATSKLPSFETTKMDIKIVCINELLEPLQL